MPRVLMLALIAIVGLGTSLFLTTGGIRLAVVAIWITLLCLSILIWGVDRFGNQEKNSNELILRDFLEEDSAPCIILNADHDVLWFNAAARTIFPDLSPSTLVEALQNRLVRPDELLFRLQTSLRGSEATFEDVIIRRGHARIGLRRIGANNLLLRVESRSKTSTETSSSTVFPTMTVSAKGTVLAVNDQGRTFLEGRPRHLDAVFGNPLPAQGQIVSISTCDGQTRSTRVYHNALPGDRREIVLLPPGPTPADVPSIWTNEDLLPVAMLRIRGGGRLLHANAAARKLLGIKGPLALDALFSDYVTGLGRPVPDWIDEALLGATTVQSEVLSVRKGPEGCFVQVLLARGIEEDSQSLVAILHDATELKTMEAQVAQGQKMQAVGQLAGGIAHDFNNLLTAITGHCDLLLLRHDQGDQDYSDLVQINQNANRAASLVGQLLAFSRKQSLSPEVLDLRDALSDLTHLLNRLVGETVTLSLYHDPELPSIKADKRQLEQVIMNLVVNARDAMSKGGEITVETQRTVVTDPLEIGRAKVPLGEYAVISVTDQGVGIPPHIVEKVFEPFFTTKKTGEGTGLGLSTAYGIVKQSGGFIFVDSIIGKGTEFKIFLPAYHGPLEVSKPLPTPSAATALDDHDTHQGIILLVEDEGPVRAFAARALRLRGYTVLEAASGEEALDQLDAPGIHVDLFVSDVVMPGMDGPSWVRKAREMRPQTKVVFVSGYAEDLLSAESMEMENSVFLPKPFSLVQLTETVQAQIPSKTFHA